MAALESGLAGLKTELQGRLLVVVYNFV